MPEFTVTADGSGDFRTVFMLCGWDPRGEPA
jgi:hypothetical protein